MGRLPGGDQRPYGLAKKLLLAQAQADRAEYGMNAVHLLPVNLYGPGDNLDLETSHVIPAMIRRFAEARERGEPSVTLWGDGSPTREFLAVGDAARTFKLALERWRCLETSRARELLGFEAEVGLGGVARTVGWVGEHPPR